MLSMVCWSADLYSVLLVPGVVTVKISKFHGADRCRWVFLQQKKNDFDIRCAGAKDTEWIGPIYGARLNHALACFGEDTVAV